MPSPSSASTRTAARAAPATSASSTAGGRYILPLDADNKLLPDAVEALVRQLSRAPEDIGFIYPNLQYFGNREDYNEVPEYNLYTLLHGNFCDTCSLLDRRIFDAGERYREEIRLGHEDWEFALRLASRGVRGEAARVPTVLYRKWGFNRSDLVDHSGEPFEEVLGEISPFRGREAEVKAKESPALSLLVMDGLAAGAEETPRVAAGLAAQSIGDVELLAHFEGEWPGEAELPPVRRLEDAPGGGDVESLRAAVATARGSHLALTEGSGASVLENHGFCEMVLRRFAASGDGNEVDAIALVDVGEEGRYPLRALTAAEKIDQRPHTVIWRRSAELDLPHGLMADTGDPIGSIARLFSGAGLKVEWRHATGEPERPRQARERWEELPSSRDAIEDPHDLRPGAQTLFPAAGEYRVPPWERMTTWVPALSTIASRYRERYGSRMIVTNGAAPPGFVGEYHLGALKSVSLAGTAKLVRIGDEYRMLPPGDGGEPPEGAEDIGYVELFGFPQMDVITLAVHRETGQQILMNLTEDPMHAEADFTEILGYLDPFPPRPRRVPECSGPPLGLVGLVKTVDIAGRRHRYAIGEVPDGELVQELGALADSSLGGTVPVWIVDGYLVTQVRNPQRPRSAMIDVARWIGEPAAHRGAGKGTRSWAMARRSVTALSRFRGRPRPADQPDAKPDAWLFDSYRPGRAPLYAAYHPVTGDQLLVRSGEDAAALGYGEGELLGYVRRVAPVTGELEPRQLAIPWARRFGAVPLSG